MDKRLFDIISGMAEAAGGDPDEGMTAAKQAMREMEVLLKEVRLQHPEAIETLDPLLEQTQAMGTLIGQAAAAQAVGDHEAAQTLSQQVAALGGGPEYEPETDPEYNALSEVLDEDNDAALAAVLDSMDELNCHLGKYRQSPLGMALSAPGRSAARVRMFLDRGARADFATPEGYTPLHFIGDYMWTGDTPDTLDELTAIVSALVAAGADIEARTHWGWTPLVRAAFEGSELEMQALLAAGADPNARVGDEGPGVSSNKSLLMLVAAEPDKVSLLLDHGADVAASGIEAHIARELGSEDHDGYTPYWDGLRESRRLIEGARRR